MTFFLKTEKIFQKIHPYGLFFGAGLIAGLGYVYGVAVLALGFWTALFLLQKNPCRYGYAYLAFHYGYYLMAVGWIPFSLRYVGLGHFLIPAVLTFPLLFVGVSVLIARFLIFSIEKLKIRPSFAFSIACLLNEIVIEFGLDFPWVMSSYTLPLPLAQIVSVLGVSLTSYGVWILLAMLYEKTYRWVGIGIVTLLLIGGWYRLSMYPAHEVPFYIRMVHPNIKQNEKMDRAFWDKILNTHLHLSSFAPSSLKEKLDLIIWPEAMIPYDCGHAKSFQHFLSECFPDPTVLVFGAPYHDKEHHKLYTSLYVFHTRKGMLDRYDKKHIVPFGEYIPFASLFSYLGLQKITLGHMDYSAGAFRNAIDGDPPFVPLICFDVIFAQKIEQSVPWAIEITNDAWFEGTYGAYQHYQIARIRAIEANRTLVRVTNGGYSAVIDGVGRVHHELSPDQKGFKDLLLPLVQF